MASASTRISIATTCKGLACQTATYSWQLVIVNSIGHELPGNILTRNMTETDMDLPGIIIKGNQLPPLNVSEWFYRLKVWVSQDHGPAGNAAYQFRVNAPPSSGNCTVTPKSGQALKTAFSFLCTGWQVRNKLPIPEDRRERAKLTNLLSNPLSNPLTSTLQQEFLTKSDLSLLVNFSSRSFLLHTFRLSF